jgi:STE24 endopeptidase
MHWLTVLFLIFLSAAMATRLWLAGRQVRAVRAHREGVPEAFAQAISLADHQKAADYTIARKRLSSIEAVVGTLVVLGLTLAGGIAAIDAAWRTLDVPQPWLGVLVIGTVMVVVTLIDLPFAIWRIFRLEARFGFNRSTPTLFAADLAKRLVLSVALGGPLLLAILLLMERGGRWWWLYAWLVWAVFTIVITWAWPRFIAPLFNRFTPLADAGLRERLEAMVKRCGFASKGVFVMDGSRRSAHGNAYFTGVGREKRIVFFDTLLEKLGPAEVEAVLAHELGHFRLHHVRQRLFLGLATTLVGLALLAWLARWPAFHTAFGVSTPSSHAALLIFMLVAPAFTFFVTPIASWWSRRHEFEADDFATGNADARALADALVKLYRDNAATLVPDPVHSAFYDSHPPPLVRITRLTSGAQPRAHMAS